MKTNGKYAKYNGNVYMLSRDMNGNRLILTKNKKDIDNSFADVYGSGIFSKKIELDDLEEIYSIETYGLVDNQKVYIVKEDEGMYLVGTNDCKVADKIGLKRVDKYGYEGWLNSNLVQIIEEKTIIK